MLQVPHSSNEKEQVIKIHHMPTKSEINGSPSELYA